MTQPADVRVNLHQLLKAMVEKGASDMHITAGAPPLLRIDGEVIPLKLPPLTPVDTKHLSYSIMTEEQKIAFEKDSELDLSFGVKNLSRFRGNIYLQRGAVAAAIRTIPFKILSYDELGLPPVIADIAAKPNGLVLVTGPTGSGKSTTLASIIDKINSEQRVHILTIEDPIEYLHPHKMAVVNQREIGADTASFKGALRYVLRQDPDVVLVGEMRDLDTIEAALTIAETGHLVFATLHTNSAVATINRIVDVFPAHQQDQVRNKLSFVLQGVITQQLMPRAGQPGRCLAMEILVPNAAIRNLIRENKIHQIYGSMQVGQDKHGMMTLNQSLMNLYLRRFISLEQALLQSNEVDELKAMIEARQKAGATGENRPHAR
ncbi:MAG: Twitching motility protein PilT [Labilithrix sp.]|nr:Twitching motility protein PilT [Labilithrix sp.]